MKRLIASLILITTLSIVPRAGYSVSCADLDGASVFSSEARPLYLGFFGNEFASDSINNTFGDYGSEFGMNSVRNSFSNYGSSMGLYSANNDLSLNPPKIVRRGKFIAYLSTNELAGYPGVLSLAEIDANCGFFATQADDRFIPGPLGTGWGGIDVSLAGTWWNPERDGEGYMLDFLTFEGTQLLFVAFYTYDAQGNQMYLVGVTPSFENPVTLNLSRTEGGIFGPEYDPNSKIEEPWGTLNIDFLNCTLAEITLSPSVSGFTGYTTTIERFGGTQANGVTCP